MRGIAWLNLVLIGLVLLLAALLVDSNRSDRWVRAAEDPDAAAQPGAAGGVIGVVGRYTVDSDILYMIDTNRETILVYSYSRPPSSSSSKIWERGYFQLLAGRSYKWDTLAATKVMIGNFSGAKPQDTQKVYLDNQ